jgi:hypothetical protein
MATDNKDVVQRFVKEVLADGQLDRIDELVAPGYVNRAFGVGLEAFKGMLAGLSAALPIAGSTSRTWSPRGTP